MSYRQFLVHGVVSPDLPLRLLNMFAQQDLAVDAVTLSRADDRYRVRIDVGGLPTHRANVILEKMRAMVLVEEAELNI